MSNTTEFAHLPLWHASYWEDGRYQDTVDYGGWTAVTVHQYASTPELCGRNEDRDVWFEEDNMADPRVDAIIAALGGQAQIDDWNVNGNSLLIGYGLEQVKLAKHLANHPGGTGKDHAHSVGTVTTSGPL